MIWHKMKEREVLNSLKTDVNMGLSQTEVELRTSRYGKNALVKQKKKSIVSKFLAQLNDYMIIMLVVAAIISFGVSLYNGNPDITEPSIILAIVIINALIGVIQENKAEKSIEELNKLTALKATVLRDGKTLKINAEDVTVGDILILKSGDKVPADARIIESKMLKTDESSLTGESMSVNKNFSKLLDENLTISDMTNMLWSSTLVVSGSCVAVVTDIGMHTQVGKIAGMINSADVKKTPLQEKLTVTGKYLGFGALFICFIIFMVGISSKQNILDMFITSVSLAVAAIPEGLPAIVTVVLAIGVRKMAQKNAVVRKLPAVETLGCANVICSDKTGTLTKNKMTVERVFGNRKEVLTLSLLCNDNADPTENAIVKCGEKELLKYETINNMYKRTDTKPFNSDDKFMITVNKYNGSYKQIIKGAPDVIINKCNLPFDTKNKVLNELESMAEEALRVIAVAYYDTNATRIKQNITYNFCGLIGISDPLRPEVKKAVKICKIAGIKPVMITGDHKITASAIAKKAGILNHGQKVLTGKEIDKLTDDELKIKTLNTTVFARVTPEHKVRIVKAFQSNGFVTAMTGDGVNDAPALKQADIGCAMGSGTEVAKGSADIILVDDNFATIVEAVKQGRNIFSNIKKTVHFLLSSNMGEIFTIFIAVLLKLPAPLTAVQLLWVNLITDSLPAIALGMDTNFKEVMEEKPVKNNKSVFSGGMIFNIVVEGILISGLSLFAYFYANKVYCNIEVAQTMAFCVLAMSQLVHAFNMHSEKPIFFGGGFGNKLLILSLVLGVAMQLLLVTNLNFASFFGMSVLNISQLKLVGGLSIVPLLVFETAKLFDTMLKK